MKRFLVAVVVMAIFLPVPAAASAGSPSRQHVTQYRILYNEVWHKQGSQVAGCKLVAPRRTCHVAATDARLQHSIQVLLRVLAPPAPPPAPAAAPAQAQPIQTTTAPQSLGAAPVSSSGGYCGAYQFDYSTWKSVGMPGSPCGAPPSMQDQAAQKLYAIRGTQPWPVCGSRLASGGWAAVRQCENGGSYAP